MTRRLSLLVAIVGLNLMACCCGGLPGAKTKTEAASPAPSSPPEALDKFVERFGKPDSDDTEGDTRTLVYKPEKLKAVYVAADKEKPPKAWKIKEYLSTFSGDKIDNQAVLVWMRERDPEQKAARDAAIAAAKAKADEDAKPAVTRAKYNEVKVGMTVDEVQAILGPGKENASGPGVLIATWQSGGINNTVISVTFQNGRVQSKAIAP